MAQLNVITVTELHGGVINRINVFSNDPEGEDDAKKFVMELLEECVDEEDHHYCLDSIEQVGGFSYCDLDVVKIYSFK